MTRAIILLQKAGTALEENDLPSFENIKINCKIDFDYAMINFRDLFSTDEMAAVSANIQKSRRTH